MASHIFDHAHPKISEIIFSFPEFQPACKKFITSIHSWDTANFRVLWPDWHRPFLTMPTPKKFWSTFNLCEFVSTSKKSGYFIDLFWSYGWLKNPAIWLAENNLAHISGTKKWCPHTFEPPLPFPTSGLYPPLGLPTQPIHPKQNQKQIMHERNKLCMLQTGRKNHY